MHMNRAQFATYDTTFVDALATFVTKYEQFLVQHDNARYPNSPENVVVSVDDTRANQKFIRILVGRGSSRSVYCFVRVSDGAVLKPAGWKAPEPKQYARGSIYSETFGLEAMGPFGTIYLR